MKSKCLAVALLLLASKAILADANSDLLIAADKGLANEVQSQLNKGADANFRDPKSGMTPLMAAAGRGHTDIVRLLLARGADAKARNNGGEAVLVIAAAFVGDAGPEIAQVLISAGADLEAGDNNGTRPLLAAAATGRVEDRKRTRLK